MRSRTRTSAGRVLGIVAAAAALTVTAFAGASASPTDQRDGRTVPPPNSADRPAVSEAEPATAKAAQKLKWTADNSTTAYKSAPKKAKAGPTTIVFENSEATGNTSGMRHTLTFDTRTEGYNHDVDVDILAYPNDKNNGKWKVQVVLTKGTYRFFCTIPGHSQMQGELVVTGGGDPGDDTTAPKARAKIQGDKNGKGEYIGQAKVSITATDEGGSGVDTIEYQLDDTGWKSYTDPVTVDEIGDHTIGYRATDKAGNESKAGTKKFTVVRDDGKDTTPPDVGIMLHGDTNNDGAYVGSAEVMLNATDQESGVDKVEYKLDDAGWKTYTDPFKIKKAGDHVVKARATDKAGNTSEKSTKKFAVVQGPDDDTKPPNVSAAVLGNQGADWSYVGPVTVEVRASDGGSGVDKIQYKLDDGDWQAYKEPVPVDAIGDHTLDYRATDAAGNTSKAGTVGFTIVEESPAPRCPEPDPSPIVVMGDIGTGVRNRDASGSCTIDDLIADEARWMEHRDFVAHATSVLDDLLAEGTVTKAERGEILRAAKRSDVGKDS